jgi:hypothetical protein
VLIRRPERRESGAAMIAAIAVLVLGALIVTVIMVSSRASSEGARDSLEAAASEVLAKDAATALSTAFSNLSASEFNGFTMTEQVLGYHAERLGAGAEVIPNSSPRIPADLRTVDDVRIAPAGRFTVVQSLDDGRLGYWHAYSAKIPNWGRTPTGRVAVYVRAWTSAADGTAPSRPTIHRVELRPLWFADFQMLFDGPFRLRSDAVLTGRIHSNGFTTSLYNQYQSDLVANGIQVQLMPGASCASTARITTSSGRVDLPGGSCAASQVREELGARHNLLKARDATNRIRANCGGGQPGLAIYCSPSTDRIRVQLNGDSISVSSDAGGGLASLDARVAGDLPTQNQGAVVVASGDVVVSGTLSDSARALVIASAPDASNQYGIGSAPSVWIQQAGTVGSSPSPGATGSSFGVIADGDVVLDHLTACGVHLRGAIVTISGQVVFNPRWRSPVTLPDPRLCSGSAIIEGSMTGHFPPGLASGPTPTSPNSGYARREYRYLASLYDNPPPVAPTLGDWEVTKLAPADLGCFAAGPGGGSTLDVAREGCA